MTPENRLAHVSAELARGRESLQAARELLRLNLLNDAVSRAYYAALHFATSLLLAEGLEVRTHSGVGAMLGQYFIVPGRLDPQLAKSLARLEQFRCQADYNRFFVLTPEGAREEIEVAEDFCTRVGDWLSKQGWLTSS